MVLYKLEKTIFNMLKFVVSKRISWYNTTHMNENFIFQLLTLKKYRVYRHLFLIVFFCLALFNSEAEYKEPYETYSRIISILMFLGLVYGNMYFLVPKFLFKNQYIKYCISIIFIIIIAALIHKSTRYVYPEGAILDIAKNDINLFSFSFVVIVVVAASASVKLFQKWIVSIQLINDLEQAKTNAELEQLKNQINPHFLFNMLNNANVLTKKDPDKASEVLMKLSDLLRYQLYDSAREKVLLTSDIHFLEDFLNLEKVRRDNFDFLISKEGALNGVLISPLLFISFVENAVKHNNDTSKASFVNLYFSVQNNELRFKCENSKPAVKAIQKNGRFRLG